MNIPNEVILSIVVPCYNQAQYLDECLNSVLNQIFQNWECIIVNDESTDNTEDVALGWIAKDFRFKYLKQKNGGLSNARNTGIKTAIGKYILPLDADDKISSNYTEEALKVFTKEPQTTLVYCESHYFGHIEKPWKLPDYNYKSLVLFNIIFCSSIYKTEEFFKVGGYDENLKNGREDWDFWLSLLNENSIVVKLPIVGFFYRQKESGSMLHNLVNNSKRLKKTDNYIFYKHLHLWENCIDESLPHAIYNYTLLNKEKDKLKNDYYFLAKSVRFSVLFQSFFLKLLVLPKIFFQSLSSTRV